MRELPTRALEQLKDKYATKPDVYMQQMMQLYRKHELSFIDGKSLLGGLVPARHFSSACFKRFGT